ncbi:MAG: peptidase prolyl oligopeptidase active site region [Candidatus Angelobacter sp.]|nr:peptidase prolyl oligopeptidase active site region [Candidatus Angelobacter sp.]
MRRFTLSMVSAIAILLMGGVFAQLFAQPAAKKPFTFEDMMALKRISSPAVSPDGKWVLFAAVDVDLKENKKTSHLWMVPVTGGIARQLPPTPAGESGGRWSPDGKSYLYTSAVDGGSQVWVGGVDPASGMPTGAPKKITSISTEADGAIWSPDGKNIVFASEVFPGCMDDSCNKFSDQERANSKVKAMLFERLLFRHWNHYSAGKRSHLFVVPAEGGVARDLTPGDHDVPPFSLGGQDPYAVSPDGQEVAFTSNWDEVGATSTNNDIFVVPITGGDPKKLSTSPGSDSTPLYSPDGKWLAWRMQKRAGYESDRFRLVVYDRKSGGIRNLTEDFDQWVETIAWSPDSKYIYFTSENKGEAPIYRLDVAAANAPPSAARIRANSIQEIARGVNDDLSVTPDGKTLVFSRLSAQAPNEVYKMDLDSKEVEELSHLNDTVLAKVAMQPVESFWFAGAAGTKVEGFLVKPPRFNKDEKYPVKFLIHGGPQGQWGDEWSYRWNAELFAADGYLVIMINPRGSTGYGQAFVDGVNKDWGGKPYIDLMNGLDYAEKTYPFIDKDRECALGASYGGYMINWILGHTNRFKCLVSHDGMFNTESAYGTTEELWFPEWEFGDTVWANREAYRKWSPHLFAAQFKTPTLVVHGQLDYRLDVSEGFQLFTTLQRQKIPSKMLYFPDEGHWVLKPQNSEYWYKTVNGWVDSYVKK